MRHLFSIALLALTTTAFAETTAGTYTLAGNAAPGTLAAPYTVIDTASPVTENGQVAAVVVRSFRSDCTDAFEVKFFRPGGDAMTVVAVRGPFTLGEGGLTKVAITPPVTVRKDDLLGITALKDCTALAGQEPLRGKAALLFAGDVEAVNISSGTPLPHFALGAYAAPSANSEVRTQVIVVAGAATGANNALFKTDVSMMNPRQVRSAGRLVYHAEGTTGVPTNISLPFAMDSSRSLTFENIVQNLGRTGKGSIDIYTTIGFEPPYASARVYDDPGVNEGTKGFSLDALTIAEALQPLTQGVLFTPVDETRYRMNIGIRTLDQPTEVEYLALTASGFQRAFVKRSYPANYYIQTDVVSLLGTAVSAGDTIIVYPRSGPVYVYGSIIDNRTNDPSAQIAKTLQ